MGNTYTTGSMNGIVDFDPGPGTFTLGSSSSMNIYVLALSSMGNFVWAKNVGSNGFSQPYDLKIDYQYNIYVTGQFEDTVDFDPGIATYDLVAQGQAEIFILKLNSSGNFIWANSFGGPLIDFGQSIMLAPAKSIYASGAYGSLADLDPGSATCSVSGSGFESYLSKFKETPVGLMEESNYSNFEIFPNPSKGIVKIKSNCPISNIEVYDVCGQMILLEERQREEINLQGVSKGVYIIQLKDRENRTVHKRLIIE